MAHNHSIANHIYVVPFGRPNDDFGVALASIASYVPYHYPLVPNRVFRYSTQVAHPLLPRPLPNAALDDLPI